MEIDRPQLLKQMRHFYFWYFEKYNWSFKWKPLPNYTYKSNNFPAIILRVSRFNKLCWTPCKFSTRQATRSYRTVRDTQNHTEQDKHFLQIIPRIKLSNRKWQSRKSINITRRGKHNSTNVPEYAKIQSTKVGAIYARVVSRNQVKQHATQWPPLHYVFLIELIYNSSELIWKFTLNEITRGRILQKF